LDDGTFRYALAASSQFMSWFPGTTTSLSFLFSGCAYFKTAEDYKNDLNQTISKEWAAKINKDWGTVYDLATQSSKNKIKRDDFIKYVNVEVLNYTIKDLQIDPSGEKAIAVIDYTTFQMGYKIPMMTKEEWVLENGQWRLEMPPGIPFPESGKK